MRVWNAVRKVKLSLCAAVVLLSCGAAARAQQTLSVAFSFPQPVVQAYGPVYLDVALHNNSPERLRVNLGNHAKWNYDFLILEPDGTKTIPPPYRQYGPGPSSNVYVEPLSTEVRHVLLNDWYVFRKPGDYFVTVKLAALMRTTSSTTWQAEFSDKLPLKVEARNPDRLRETCTSLAASALSTNPQAADSAAEASFALSYIPDPVAIPFLARLLKEGAPAVRENAIHGLARIRTSEAVDVLKSGLEFADAELKAKIESALAQLHPGT